MWFVKAIFAIMVFLIIAEVVLFVLYYTKYNISVKRILMHTGVWCVVGMSLWLVVSKKAKDGLEGRLGIAVEFVAFNIGLLIFALLAVMVSSLIGGWYTDFIRW